MITYRAFFSLNSSIFVLCLSFSRILYEKVFFFGRSCDSEWSVFDKTRYLEQVRGILAHDNISEPGKLRLNDRLRGLAEDGTDVGRVGPALDGAVIIGFDCWLRQY